ncbi:MAG: type II toxin-antitoxin system Phd/YefM family antitoxin [Gemmatimonadota bacterium]|jgi:prevent-host-death family protein|nr:type II toxin-antitoxin system Phd/YefM family antitoxin [Gemmatimonadota bacterium]
MPIRMGAREARKRFSELLGRVHYRGDTVILESSGRPMAAVVPLEMYERMLAEREAQLRVVDEMRAAMPALPEDAVDRDIAEALAAARERNATGGT